MTEAKNGFNTRSEKRGSEGFVHGHIHNYENMTYIHGHVHHTLNGDRIKTEGYDPARDFAGDINVPLAYNEAIAAKQVSPLKTGNLPSKSSDCRYFQITNYHQNKIHDRGVNNESGGNVMNNFRNLRSPSMSSSYNDDFLLLPPRKRKLSSTVGTTDENCECPPKILEICCDMEHPSGVGAEKDKKAAETLPEVQHNGGVSRYKTESSELFPQPSMDVESHPNFNFNQFLPVDCDVPCQQMSKGQDSEYEEDENRDEDIFEKFCKECLDLSHEPRHQGSASRDKQDQDDLDHLHHHLHHHSHSGASGKHSFDAPLSTPSTTSAEDSPSSFPRKEHQGYSQPIIASNSPTKNFSGHVVNSQIDLKILDDLCNISSLYEFPFANHMNHHNHDHNAKGNECVNLLESSINGTANPSYDLNETNSQSHHHHRVQLRGHKADCQTGNANSLPGPGKSTIGTQMNDKRFSVERSTIPDNSVKLESSIPVNPTVKSVDCFGLPQEANTISFNWAFKNEDNGIKCEWDQCPESYSNLIDLQKHMLKDHVADEDASCNWLSCAFEGEDTCSLINHINTDHGINFGMNIANNSKSLQEQGKNNITQGFLQPTTQQNLQLGDEGTTFACKWGGCTEIFESAADLTTHLETMHLEKGKSEYYCHWSGCDRRFPQRQKLVRHLKVHSGYKPFKCQVCDKCFSSEDTLVQHKRTHSGEKPFECRVCGRRFAVSSSLKIHMRTHTGEKPLKCKICDRRFSESSNLSKHMKSHQKRYSCTHCKKGFDNAEKLKTHQLRCSKNR